MIAAAYNHAAEISSWRVDVLFALVFVLLGFIAGRTMGRLK